MLNETVINDSFVSDANLWEIGGGMYKIEQRFYPKQLSACSKLFRIQEHSV